MEITERMWLAIAAKPFTANGTSDGIVSVQSTLPFKVKQKIRIRGNALPILTLEIKRILSATQLIVGPLGSNIKDTTDLTLYTTALSSTIESPDQARPAIPDKEYERAVFAEEPILAKRVILVDRLGGYYSEENPLPISVDQINVGEVLVQLSHTGANPDSVQVGDGVEIIQVNPDGSVNARITQVGSDSEVKNTWDEVNSVPMSTPTEIVTYTAPSMRRVYLQFVECSGENVATYEVLINGVIQARKRTYFGADLSTDFDFKASPSGNGLELQTGDIVSVRVTHNRPDPGVFDARIQAIEVML